MRYSYFKNPRTASDRRSDRSGCYRGLAFRFRCRRVAVILFRVVLDDILSCSYLRTHYPLGNHPRLQPDHEIRSTFVARNKCNDRTLNGMYMTCHVISAASHTSNRKAMRSVSPTSCMHSAYMTLRVSAGTPLGNRIVLAVQGSKSSSRAARSTQQLAN